MIIAKIERRGALGHVDEILSAADGIMVARGDLGVEVPIEEMAILQKQLIQKANQAGKPVITATQLLESMVSSRLPTRAEATDVANAILDGTDCVMLSGESAIGRFPQEAVAMLAKVAAFTESHRRNSNCQTGKRIARAPASAAEAIASLVEHALDTVPCSAIFVPSQTGKTARAIASQKPDCWVVAASDRPAVCQALVFSYGVHAVAFDDSNVDWCSVARRWSQDHDVTSGLSMLVTEPSDEKPKAGYRIEFLRG
jgi:pyruvate kinase